MEEEETNNEKPFCIDRAKQGRASCKKCKQKCPLNELRIAKLVTNPFGSGKMKNWHHLDCIFEQFLKQKLSTKRIESPEDLDGWEVLSETDKKLVIEKIKKLNENLETKYGIKFPKKNFDLVQNNAASLSTVVDKKNHQVHRDCLFREFRRLVADISNENSYLEKTKLVREIFKKGSDGNGFKGDITLWCRLLLPGVSKRIYNLQNKQLIKLFSKIFETEQNDMLEHLEQGDIGETIQKFFEESKKIKPATKSKLTVRDVDEFLEELSKITKEDEQIDHFKSIVTKCTPNDLKIIIRLIRHDLRMNAGAKHILQGIHPDAYEVYQSLRDLDAVVSKCLRDSNKEVVKASVSLMIPCLPMLAEACKSVEQAMTKCPNGMYSEIKYDGERVQIHKKDTEFKYFSRSLKPVLPHKIAHFEEYIPKAFPYGKDMILDSEILMVDAKSGKPLPFGTLGIHKKNEFKDATVCLFIFDCIYYNGEVLTSKPIKQRKQILKDNMIEIKNHIMLSEMQEIHKPEELKQMIVHVLKEGLEGLVLKDIYSIYEPGKRHWLKVKKDYLFEGAMADSADLIVLGAWYGTGKKGGMMSVFLMGCYDSFSKKFCTVTKVHTGHDDETIERLQSELDMIKISCDQTKVPDWLKCTKTMVPDFIANDPKKQPVWEISGAEFTQHEVHTADGISIRFPRVTKIRNDKTWETATNLQELQILFKRSKEGTDVSLLLKDTHIASSPLKRKNDTNENNSIASPSKKIKEHCNSSPEKQKSKIRPSKKQNNLLSFISKPSTSKTPDLKNSQRNVIAIKNPLPDYFIEAKLLLGKGIKEEHFKMLRYFIAFGGTIVEPENWKNATHMVHLTKSTNRLFPIEDIINHVTVEWLKDSILKKELQNADVYRVILEPNYIICKADEICEFFL